MLKQAFIATFALAILVSLTGAQVVGTSTFKLPSSVIYVHQGNSTNLNGSVTLVNGTASGSTLTVVNSKNLSSEGITVYLPNGYGTPPYFPRMTISASSTTPVGNYTIVFYEAGDDQALSNTLATLVVLSPSTPIPATSTVATTLPTTTMPVNNTGKNLTTAPTTIPTTVSGNPPTTISYNATYAYIIIAVVVIVVLIIIALAIYWRHHKF